ncbi:DedA family protein [Novosphingobium sp.]|jgi:membrane protein DedA with SNARE-associated domain|uniref:DedA family protein n=1 Tax=Novosphingobium sp. TaxID=1874826 RepID=UPI0022C7C0CA|nr:DedA family protein [Novosphingobium sp.]MCZ8017308.1 DedA family protein [Novosphingobium sp.]MCZ8034169.1 DedA family protein [Novosphingobium sp.]MCZ8051524.1 DedA family protein [Novosphingobium sp.]MCZ8059870.1 DedA family protein [Novosphingobium sp.]MCZ8231708.1 DedA family protein [Novosphingobium sp.]
MEDWIIRLVDWAGYWGVAALMLLETVFPPVPSEVIMTVAGVSAARGNMTLEGTILAGTAGAMLGNWFWYWLAMKFGEARMHVFIDKYNRWLTLDWDEVERGERLFARYGSIIVLVARMIPTLRSLISIPAGIFKMPLGRFLAFSTIGTLGWSAALAGAGFFLGSQFGDVEKWLGPLSTLVIAAIVLTYLWRIFTWKPKG